MSYILDALNKSEQERKRRDAPDLATIHRRPVTAPVSRSIWPWMFGLVVLVNLGFGAYWLWHDQNGEPTASTPNSIDSARTKGLAAQNAAATSASKPTPQPAPQPAPMPAADTRMSNPTTEQDAGVPASGSSSKNDAPPAGVLVTPQDLARGPARPAPADTGEAPMRISELPENIQRQIPDMVFSSHIYADDPTFRMVNINGKIMHEGDMVTNGLQLVRITEDGVVLNYRQYTFEVSVLHDWSFD